MLSLDSIISLGAIRWTTSNKGSTGVRRLHVNNDVDVTVGFHANLYESAKLKGIDGGAKALDSTSSIHRYARMSQMAPATSTHALEAVVSDTQDPEYPIHRNGAKPDMYMTLNSVLFDVHAQRILVWGTEAPTRAAAPTLGIEWRTLQIHIP